MERKVALITGGSRGIGNYFLMHGDLMMKYIIMIFMYKKA